MSSTREESHAEMRGRIGSIFGGSIGNLIEWYDFYVYNFFALYFAKSFFPGQDPTVQLLNTFGIYAIGFLIRPVGGLILGVCASVVCFYAVDLVKHRLKIDDSLDVFAVHGVGGILGSLLVAVLAHPALGGVGYGSVGGMAAQAAVQVEGVLSVLAWSAAGTLVILFITKRLTGLRARDEDIDDGLDLATHGERSLSI